MLLFELVRMNAGRISSDFLTSAFVVLRGIQFANVCRTSLEA